MLSARRRINLSHMRDSCHKLGMKLNQGNSEVLPSWQEQEERFSSNLLGHLPDKLVLRCQAQLELTFKMCLSDRSTSTGVFWRA